MPRESRRVSSPAIRDTDSLLSAPGAGARPVAPSGVPGAEWYAVYTTPRHEKRIAQHFANRAIEHFLPLYTVARRWRDGSRVEVALPLFPSYIFVQILKVERVRVLDVPGVIAIVGGTGGHPATLPGNEMIALRDGLAEHRAEPHPLLVAGQRGRIRTGALRGMQGVVIRVKNDYRVVLTIELIMQSIAVEVDAGDIELLDRV